MVRSTNKKNSSTNATKTNVITNNIQSNTPKTRSSSVRSTRNIAIIENYLKETDSNVSNTTNNKTKTPINRSVIILLILL